MEPRYELRMEAMLEECEVSPRVFEGVMDRLSEFVKPFAALLGQPVQRERTAEYVSDVDDTRSAQVFAQFKLICEQLPNTFKLGAARAAQRRRVIVHEDSIRKSQRKPVPK